MRLLFFIVGFFGCICVFGQNDIKTIKTALAEIDKLKILELEVDDTLFVSIRNYELKKDGRYFVYKGDIKSTKKLTVCDSEKNLNHCLRLYFKKEKPITNNVEFSLMNYSMYNGSFDMKLVDGEFEIVDSRFVKSNQ
jgi:hypothetical protein